MNDHQEKILLLAPYEQSKNSAYLILTGNFPNTLELTLQATLFMLKLKQDYLLKIRVFNPTDQEVANSVAHLTPEALDIPQTNIVENYYISSFTLSMPSVNFYEGIFRIQVELLTNSFEVLDTASTFIIIQNENNLDKE